MEDGGQVDPESKIRLVVPNSSCGGIIGKGGAIIRLVCLFLFLCYDVSFLIDVK